jgi:hypothetical protein
MRRAILLMVLFAALGVVSTVMIAWLSVWLRSSSGFDLQIIEVRQVGGRPPSAGPVLAEVATHWGSTRVSAWSKMPPGAYPLYDTRKPGRAPSWVPELLWCDEAALDRDEFCSGRRVAHTEWFAAGWPLRALRGAYGNMLTSDDRAWITGAERGSWLLWKDGWPLRLPYEPIWPGLLANATFYGGLLALVLLAPGQIRRALRRRRGACMRCGYDLRGGAHAGCPECGPLIAP